MTTQRYGGPTAADYLGAMLQERGIFHVDMDRLADRVLAVQERRQARRDGAVDQVRQLAAGVWRARQAAEAASIAQRIEPSADTLRALRDAVSQRSAAEDELREALLHDDDLMTRVLAETRP